MGRRLEAHHYCRHVNEDFFQCVIYDDNRSRSDSSVSKGKGVGESAARALLRTDCCHRFLQPHRLALAVLSRNAGVLTQTRVTVIPLSRSTGTRGARNESPLLARQEGCSDR
jgi:hypothetical protein